MTTAPQPRAVLPWGLGILAVALVLRVCAAGGELWLDEQWTVLAWLPQMQGPLDALLHPELRHDNNHVLATIWLYLVGAEAPVHLQRLLAILCGLATVALAWPRAARGPLDLLPMGLLAWSFAHIIYSSEMRGYAVAVCCMLGSWRMLRGAEARGFEVPPWQPALFGLVQILGLLGHLNYGQALLGLGVWFSVGLARQQGAAAALRRAVLWFGPTLGFVCWLYLARVQHLVFGGGTSTGPAATMLEALAWLSGMPQMAVLVLPLAGAWAFLILRHLRGRLAEGLGLLTTLALVPAALLVLNPEASILYPRFFLLGLTWLLLLGGEAMVQELRAGRWQVPGAVLLVFVCGQAHKLGCFFTRGMRGDLSPAVAQVVADAGPKILLSGLGGDFRLKLSLGWVQKRHPEWQVGYMPEAQAMAQPEGLPYLLFCDTWHQAQPRAAPHRSVPQLPPPMRARDTPQQIPLRNGLYQLAAEYPYSGPSGLRFLLYRRVR